MNPATSVPLLALAALAITLPDRRTRRALAGLVLVALGLASLQVAGGPAWREANLPVTYLALTAALLLVGLALPLSLAVISLREGAPDGRRRPVLLLTALATGLVGGRVWLPLALAGGMIRTLAGAVVLLASAVVLRLLTRMLGLGERLRRLDRSLFAGQVAAPDESPPPGAWPLLAGHLGLAALTLSAPHLILLLFGVVGTVATGVWLDRARAGSARWPASLVAGLVVLAGAACFLLQVAGPIPPTLAALREGPFSVAFEFIAALMLLVAAWPLLQLWPFHARCRGPATRLAGGAVLVLLAAPVLPSGMGHWQPVVFPLLALSSWYAAGIGSAPLALTALATAGMISLGPAGAWAGLGLMAGVVALELPGWVLPRRAMRGAVAGGVAGLGAAVLLPLLAGALQAQVFYTVLLTAGLVTMLLTWPAEA
jgi:hypothetical protein